MRELVERLVRIAEAGGDAFTVAGMALALAASTAAALAVQLLYEYFYEHRETGSQIHRSFLLLSPSITLLFIAVQLSLPLSLGLLGALSIVRFRVPIREPEEVGFLMVVIAAAIGCATYSYGLVAMLFAVVVVVLVGRDLWARRRTGPEGGVLLLTLRDEEYGRCALEMEELLRAHLGTIRLEHLSGKDGTTTLNYAFRGRPKVAWPRMKAELGSLCHPDALSVVFTRPGGL